jgi:O-antigen/teichoic acid export membrane protein
MIAPSIRTSQAQRVRALASSHGVAFADQAVSSLSNFIAVLLVARYAGPAEFATFSLSFAIWFLALGVQRSLLIEPMIIGAGAHTGDDLKTFLRRADRAAFPTAALIAATVMALSLVGMLITPSAWRLGVGVPLSVALGPLLMQDYWRWRSLAGMTPKRALTNDIVFALCEVVIVVVVGRSGGADAHRALTAIGIAAAIASLFGLWQIRQESSASPMGWRAQFDAGLVNGKWLLAEFSTQWVYWQGAAFLLAFLLGARLLGQYRALDALFGPARTAVLGMSAVALPAFSRRFATAGKASLDGAVTSTRRWVIVITGAYALLLGVGGPLLVRTSLGSAYAGLNGLLWIMGIQFVLFSSMLPVTLGLKVAGAARALFGLRVLIAIVAICSTVAGAIVGGIWGACIGGAIGAAVAAWLPYRTYRKANS